MPCHGVGRSDVFPGHAIDVVEMVLTSQFTAAGDSESIDNFNISLTQLLFYLSLVHCLLIRCFPASFFCARNVKPGQL